MPGAIAELDLRLAEFRGVGGDDEIRHHRKLAAAAQRKAGHRRNPRLARRRHALEPGEDIPAIHRGKSLRQHLLNIRPGGKGLLAPRQHQAKLRGIGIIGREHSDQLLHEPGCSAH